MFNNLTNLNNPAAVAATGSTQADAAAITAKATVVSAADATKGVIMPSATGDSYLIVNSVAAVLKIYPPTGGTINGGSANAAYSLAASKNAIVLATSLDTFRVIASA